jgi:hypothetical protein
VTRLPNCIPIFADSARLLATAPDPSRHKKPRCYAGFKGFQDFVRLLLNPVVGAPGEIRTPDHQVRSLVLYPAELRAHGITEASRELSGVAIIASTIELAEREGFEPSIRLLTRYSLSRGAPSASRASLRNLTAKQKCNNRRRQRLVDRSGYVRIIPDAHPSLRSGPALRPSKIAPGDFVEPSIRLLTRYSLSRGAPSASRAPLRFFP